MYTTENVIRLSFVAIFHAHLQFIVVEMGTYAHVGTVRTKWMSPTKITKPSQSKQNTIIYH